MCSDFSGLSTGESYKKLLPTARRKGTYDEILTGCMMFEIFDLSIGFGFGSALRAKNPFSSVVEKHLVRPNCLSIIDRG